MQEINQHSPALSDYDSLAFKGGSVRGRAYLDAIRVLEQCGFELSRIQRVIGTSAGAIMAFGLALGYTIDELEKLQDELDYEKILDDNYQTRDILFSVKDKVENSGGFFKKSVGVTAVSSSHSIGISQMSVSLGTSFGIYEGHYFLDWAEKIAQKAGLEKSKEKKVIKDLTFGQLHEWVLTNEKNNTQFKDLYLVAYDVIQGVSHVLSWETDKNMPIADAVRASMSIPLIFKPYPCRLKKKEGIVLPDESRLFVDGGTTGLMENFPLRKLDYQHYVEGTLEEFVLQKPLKQPMYNPKVLGFCLVDPEQELQILDNNPLPKTPINSFVPFLMQVLKGFYGRQDQTAYLQEDAKRTIFIQTAGVGMLDFNLTPEKKKALDAAGREGTTRFLKTYYPEQAKKTTEKIGFSVIN